MMRGLVISALTILSLASCMNDGSRTQVRIHILPSEIQSKIGNSRISINHYDAQNTFSINAPSFSTSIDRAESFSSSEDLPDRPHGSVIIRPNGYISFATDDDMGKHSYISCAIEDADLQELGVVFSHRWDSTTNSVVETLETTAWFDQGDNRYYALGPKSDGSLATNAKKAAARFHLRNGAKNNMRVRDCVIGWLEIKN